jgi:hypothetical protein
VGEREVRCKEVKEKRERREARKEKRGMESTGRSRIRNSINHDSRWGRVEGEI